MMHFCSCGSFECICDGKCICARRYCLCTSCHDLRRKEWCKVCGLPSSYRELSASTAVADVCKCSYLTIVNPLPNRFGRLDVSSEVLTEDVKTSESPCVKQDYEFQEQHPIPSILTRWPMEQEMVRVLEFGKAQIPPDKKMKAEELSKFSVYNTERNVYSTNVDSSNSKFPSPGLATATESSPISSLQGSSIHEQQELFQATSFTEPMLFLTDKGKLFSSERVPTQSPNFCVRRCGSRNSKDNPSETSLDSDFSFLEMPKNKWNSDFSIIEMPGDDTNSCSRINSYFTGDLTSAARTSSLPSEQTDKPHPCFSSLPTIHVSSGSLISPSVQRSSVISSLGHLPHFPSSNSQLSKCRNIPHNQTKSCASISATAVTSVQATSSLSGDTLTSSKSFHPLAESRRVYEGLLTLPLKPIHSPESQDMSQTVETERELSEKATAVESPKVVVKFPEQLHRVSPDKEL